MAECLDILATEPKTYVANATNAADAPVHNSAPSKRTFPSSSQAITFSIVSSSSSHFLDAKVKDAMQFSGNSQKPPD